MRADGRRGRWDWGRSALYAGQFQQVAVVVIRASAEELRQGLIPGERGRSWEGRRLTDERTVKYARTLRLPPQSA
jgi:hypothetical protein